jgi:hypothetical protein
VPVTSEWEAVDDRIRQQVYSDDWEDTLPLPFIAAVSTFGTALTGVRFTRFSSVLAYRGSQLIHEPRRDLPWSIMKITMCRLSDVV